MPSLTNHQAHTRTKMLLIGESGSGKTGAMASLVKAGYKLVILDFDSGLDILVSLLSPEEQANVYYVNCTDKMKTVNGKIMVSGTPKAWTKAMNFLSTGKDGDLDLGPLSELGPEWIVVDDSFTFTCLAAMRHVLALNGRVGRMGEDSGPRIQDWGQAMGMAEDLIALLYSDEFKPNVLVTSHVAYIESDDGVTMNRGLPMALGAKLSPKVPRYFNTVCLAKTVGSGPSAKKYIFTRSEGVVELKNAAPGKLPDRLPLESGLATIFKTLQG